MLAEQRRKGFLSTWHNFHLPSAWLTVTTKPHLGQKNQFPRHHWGNAGMGRLASLTLGCWFREPSAFSAMLDLAAVTEGPAHTVTKKNKMAQKVYFLSLIWFGVVMQDGEGYFPSPPLFSPSYCQVSLCGVQWIYSVMHCLFQCSLFSLIRMLLLTLGFWFSTFLCSTTDSTETVALLTSPSMIVEYLCKPSQDVEKSTSFNSEISPSLLLEDDLSFYMLTVAVNKLKRWFLIILVVQLSGKCSGVKSKI